MVLPSQEFHPSASTGAVPSLIWYSATPEAPAPSEAVIVTVVAATACVAPAETANKFIEGAVRSMTIVLLFVGDTTDDDGFPMPSSTIMSKSILPSWVGFWIWYSRLLV